MLPTIKLDNQSATMTCKISNVSSNWHLPAKMPRFALEKPKLLPQLLLRVGDIAAKVTRELIGH
jgi:hypothetical protein